MPPTTKPHLLDEIRRQRADLEAILDRIPPDRLAQPIEGDGWSVKDILAHIAAWEQLMLRWWRAGQSGETPTDPSPGLTDGDVERLNADFYQTNRGRSLADVQADFQGSFAAVMAALEAAPEAALMQPGYFPWSDGEPFAYFVIANTSDHYHEHRMQIAAWAGTT